MAKDLLGRAGLAHQHAAGLAYGIINSLDGTGPLLAFGTGPVLPAGQHLGVGFPLVGKEPTVAVVIHRQGLPEATQRRLAPAAEGPAHDVPPGPFGG